MEQAITEQSVNETLQRVQRLLQEVNTTRWCGTRGQYSRAAMPVPGELPSTDHPSFRPFMLTGYLNGAGDSCLEEKKAWLVDRRTTEVLSVSRPFNCLEKDESTDWELRRMAQKSDCHIEKTIIWRAQPGFNKEITSSCHMTAGVWTWCEWRYYIFQHLAKRNSNFKETFRNFSLKDHGRRVTYAMHYVTW